MKENKIYNTALYCRLSLDDGSVGESGSIQTQKIILEEYAKIHGFKIYDVYVDDGYSGLNFNRPGFQRMIQDIQGGKINLVITKDLSRLGRNYIETGYYTEHYFKDVGVRYIAVNSWYGGKEKMISQFMDHGKKEGYKNVIQYTKSAKNIIKNGSYITKKNAFIIQKTANKFYYVGVGQNSKLITTYYTKTLTKTAMALLGLI